MVSYPSQNFKCRIVHYTTGWTWLFNIRRLHGGPKQRGHRLMATILSNLNRFKKKFTARFLQESRANKYLRKIKLNLRAKVGICISTYSNADESVAHFFGPPCMSILVSNFNFSESEGFHKRPESRFATSHSTQNARNKSAAWECVNYRPISLDYTSDYIKGYYALEALAMMR